MIDNIPNYALANPFPATLEQQVDAHPKTNQQRAVVILGICMATLSHCEVAGEDPPDMIFFSTPPGGKVGRNGYMELFPGMPGSPVGMFRGNGMSCDVVEIITFIGKNFTGVMDQVIAAMSESVADDAQSS